MRWIAFGVCLLSAAVGAAPQTAVQGGQPGPAQPGPAPANRAAPAAGTGRVRGVVVSDIGAPIRDAEIILSGQQVREGRSDDNGRFDFDGLQAGRFYLSVTKAGFGTQVTTIQSSVTAPPSFVLADGQTLDRTVTLPRGGVIKGRLVDASGEPLANAEMRVERFVYGPGGRQPVSASHSAKDRPPP